MNQQHIIQYVINHFPTTTTNEIAVTLNISPFQVRTIAKRHNIKKSEEHLANIKLKLRDGRKLWYESRIPEFKPTFIQEQVIFGSMLGDGYISKGAQRSKNFYYQEHFGESQRGYREWKQTILKNLGFKINGNYLRSPSHPYFTKLHAKLYNKKIKILSKDFLAKCTDSAFLASLYLDDGSLVLTYHYNKKQHTVYCHPSIILYTLNFTKDENTLLANHLNKTFNTHFVVSGHPHGKRSLLKINKQKDVQHFLEMIKPYTSQIQCIHYKASITNKLNQKTEGIYERFGKDVTIKLSSSNRNKPYSKNEIETIIHLKQSGFTDKYIAEKIGRSYWSVVYKLRELRMKGYL